MSAIIKQTSIVLLSVVSLLGISRAAVAAIFNFDVEGNQGSLQFDSSPLTGVGSESISLDQIPDVKYPPLLWGWIDEGSYGNPTNVPVFDFYNGELVGIHARYSYGNVYTPYSYPGKPERPSKISSADHLDLNGNNWEQRFASARIYLDSPNSPPLLISSFEKSGSISFKTIEPIGSNSVPEASNALGVFLGLAGILGFKSRLR
jgi:hypothetical protein